MATLLEMAQQVLSSTRQLMLPGHGDVLRPRLVTFDEMVVYSVNATGINKGRYRTHIFLLTKPGQTPSVTWQQSHEDTVIIDLSLLPPDIDLPTMQRFLLTSDRYRRWHHAPWLVFNMLKRNY